MIERRRRKLDRRYIRAAPHVIANSEFTAQQLRGVYGVTCKVLPSGVDADAFRPAAEPRERFVLAVGALSPLKGHELVIDAVAALPAPRPQLVIVGDRGESEPLLRARAVRAGVQLVVRQGIPFSEVVRLYQRASVVACGQIREPLGLVPLEAMACATPVVAVDDGGFRETIRNGETGLLVPRHPRAMAAALARVLENASLAARLGQAGRTHVIQRWSSQRMIRGFDAVLTQVADEKHSVGGNPHSSSAGMNSRRRRPGVDAGRGHHDPLARKRHL